MNLLEFNKTELRDLPDTVISFKVDENCCDVLKPESYGRIAHHEAFGPYRIYFRKCTTQLGQSRYNCDIMSDGTIISLVYLKADIIRKFKLKEPETKDILPVQHIDGINEASPLLRFTKIFAYKPHKHVHCVHVGENDIVTVFHNRTFYKYNKFGKLLLRYEIPRVTPIMDEVFLIDENKFLSLTSDYNLTMFYKVGDTENWDQVNIAFNVIRLVVFSVSKNSFYMVRDAKTVVKMTETSPRVFEDKVINLRMPPADFSKKMITRLKAIPNTNCFICIYRKPPGFANQSDCLFVIYNEEGECVYFTNIFCSNGFSILTANKNEIHLVGNQFVFSLFH